MRLFLEGRHKDLAGELRARMEEASEATRFEEAAALRDLIATVEELDQKQKMAAADGDDTDIFGCYAEPPLVAVNVFHLRNGRIVDRREFFWEDQHEFEPAEFFSSLLKQFYLDQPYVPARIHVPVDFEDREALEELLTEKRGRKVEIHTPQRGQKKAMLDAGRDQREAQLRPALPRAEAHRRRPSRRRCEEALGSARAAPPHRVLRHLPHPGHRHGRQHGGLGGRPDEEVRLPQVHHPRRRGNRRLRLHARGGHAALLAAAATRGVRMPGLVLIDGGIGQLHAAAEALEALGIINQPLASIAKREEWIYVLGQEDEPVVLDRFSPVLHLVQTIRDEAHRFAVTFHRDRRRKSFIDKKAAKSRA